MKTTRSNLLQRALASLVIVTIAMGSAYGAKGAKPVKPPPEPPPPPFENVYYDIAVTEPNEADPFWLDALNQNAIGRIEHPYPDDRMIINREDDPQVTPTINLGALPTSQDCSGASSPEELLVCFPAETLVQQATVLVTRINEDDPTTPESEEAVIVTIEWMAYSKQGNSQFYRTHIHATPVGTATWRPLDLGVDGFATLKLGDWRTAAGTGAEKKACIACGSFGGATTLTVTRRAGP